MIDRSWRGQGLDIPRPAASVEYLSEWHPSIRKDGRLGRRLYLVMIAYTPLSQCRRCGVWGTPKRVQERNDCYRTDIGLIDNNFCMSCWAKVRPKVALLYRLDELQKLANRLRRTKSVR